MALGSCSSSAILFCSGIACCLGAVCDRICCRCLRNSGSVRSAKGLGEGGPEYLRLRPSGGAKFAGQGLPVEWTSSGTVEVAAGVENEKQKQHCHKRCELAVVCQWPVAIQSQSQLRTGNPSQWNQSVPGQINPTLFSKSRTLSPLMPRTRFESFIVLSARCPDGVLRQYLVRYSLSLGKPLECFLNNQARRSRVDPLSWGQYGGTKDSSYSFQYLRRPGRLGGAR